jgi:chromosome segregation ATPase
MKQRTLERRLEKLNLKLTKAKTELAAARRRASSTSLAARSARQAQRLAKKSAHAARTAESAFTRASRAFSKMSSRREKLQKKLLKSEKTAVTQKDQSTKAHKPAKRRRVPAPPFPISGDKTSAPAIARATAAAAKRGALQRPPEPRAIPARPITPVAPMPEAQVAAAS